MRAGRCLNFIWNIFGSVLIWHSERHFIFGIKYSIRNPKLRNSVTDNFIFYHGLHKIINKFPLNTLDWVKIVVFDILLRRSPFSSRIASFASKEHCQLCIPFAAQSRIAFPDHISTDTPFVGNTTRMAFCFACRWNGFNNRNVQVWCYDRASRSIYCPHSRSGICGLQFSKRLIVKLQKPGNSTKAEN